MPDGVGVEWEMLEKGRGGAGWQRLQMLDTDEESALRATVSTARCLGVCASRGPTLADEGFGRGRFTLPDGATLDQIPRFRP